MNTACDLCKGACCSSFVVPLNVAMLTNQDRRFFRLRGTIEVNSLRIQAPCSVLGKDGRCGDYDGRPDACRTYKVGGDACRAAIKAQRSPEHAAAIVELLP